MSHIKGICIQCECGNLAIVADSSFSKCQQCILKGYINIPGFNITTFSRLESSNSLETNSYSSTINRITSANTLNGFNSPNNYNRITSSNSLNTLNSTNNYNILNHQQNNCNIQDLEPSNNVLNHQQSNCNIPDLEPSNNILNHQQNNSNVRNLESRCRSSTLRASMNSSSLTITRGVVKA